MKIERVRVLVNGVVQGVGFRPFVYRLAHECQLAGTVRNRGDAGVEIELEGANNAIRAFTQGLSTQAPPLARIDSVAIESLVPQQSETFEILPSTEDGSGSGLLPPDIAICDACVSELLGDSRFHGYWATSCTDCGPRFTVIDGLPYDRPKTTMRDFPMCASCNAEYTDPLDRRYHAQTTACDACGPTLAFDGVTDKALERAIEALRAGKILAIKGIGGTHIACSATDAEVIDELRQRLGRRQQPFALMATAEQLQQIAEPTDTEISLLESIQRPIVLVRKRASVLPDAVAPGLHTVGIMLPYSGLHHLLLAELLFPLVMTSANMPGRPMLIENDAIHSQLKDVVDHVLVHDRAIAARCDDSVQRVVSGTALFLRRSRGHVPQAIDRDLGTTPMLALGPESDLTFAIYAEGRVTPSQHIGNVDDLETLEYLTEAIDHLYAITHAAPPARILCDAHPDFMTTGLAAELARVHGAEVQPVQHHEAHFASVLVEHDLKHAIGIILDGYGFGWDGAAWGGEFFLAADRRIERIGSLRSVPMPGGDRASAQPLRMAASYLVTGGSDLASVESLLIERGLSSSDAGVLLQQVERGINAPLTSSCGRFLDAVSAWAGICSTRTYEGEPAMKLEASAIAGKVLDVLRGESFLLEANDRLELDVASLFTRLVQQSEGFAPRDLAATAQALLADRIAALAIRLAECHDVEDVAFSGGVAYNEAITQVLLNRLESAGLRLFRNRAVPSGDGGVAFGQLSFAGRFIRPV